MERPRARSGTGCSWVGPARRADSGAAGRAGRSRLATASAHGSVPAPISFRSDRQRGSGLEFQHLQKRAVASRVVEGMLDALLLDVTVLVIDVRNAGQEAPEIYRAVAELRVARAILHDVLQMEAQVAIAVPLEIGERVATTHDHVADVELVADDRRVGSLDEHIVRYSAVDGRHVVRLVVEGEPDARAPGGGAGGVEAVGPLPPVVERAGRVRCEARHDQVLMAEPVGDGEAPLPSDEHDGGRDVRRGRAQPFVIEGGPDLLGGPAEVTE